MSTGDLNSQLSGGEVCFGRKEVKEGQQGCIVKTVLVLYSSVKLLIKPAETLLEAVC